MSAMGMGGGRRHGRGGPQKMNVGALKAMGKSLKPFAWMIVLALLFLAINVALSLIAPEFLSALTNEMATPSSPDGRIDLNIVQHNAIILVFVYLGTALCSYGSGFLLSTVTQKYSYSLRQEMEKKINRMPLSYFDAHPHGETISTITNDVDQMSQSFEQGLQQMVQSVLMLSAVTVIMFIKSWAMALAAMASLPLMLGFILFVAKLARPQFAARQAGLASVEGVSEENYSGLEVINAFKAQESKAKLFIKENEKLRVASFKAQNFGGLFGTINNFISYFAYAAVLLVGGILLTNGSGAVSYGTLTAFLVYVRLFQQPLTNIGQAMNSLSMASASSERVFAFLHSTELRDETDKPLCFKNKEIEGKSDFVNVKFGYEEDKLIIPDFSAWVEPGMKVAIVGPTGAGKTTMVNLLMRFYEIQGGQIQIDGIPTVEMKREEIHDIFGMVLQDSWIFQGTLRENLVYNTPNVSEERILKAIEDANLTHFVATLPNGLDTRIEDENSLSGGQKQLLTIARAMIKNAPLLILDEATSSVDTRTEELIQESMDRLTKGRTSFVIAHRLSTIRNADLILVLKDGNIIEKGTHASLLEKQGFYAELYNAQFSLGKTAKATAASDEAVQESSEELSEENLEAEKKPAQ